MWKYWVCRHLTWLHIGFFVTLITNFFWPIVNMILNSAVCTIDMSCKSEIFQFVVLSSWWEGTILINLKIFSMTTPPPGTKFWNLVKETVFSVQKWTAPKFHNSGSYFSHFQISNKFPSFEHSLLMILSKTGCKKACMQRIIEVIALIL